MLPEEVFCEAMLRFWEKKVRKRSILVVWCLLFGHLICYLCFRVGGEKKKKVWKQKQTRNC